MKIKCGRDLREDRKLFLLRGKYSLMDYYERSVKSFTPKAEKDRKTHLLTDDLNPIQWGDMIGRKIIFY